MAVFETVFIGFHWSKSHSGIHIRVEKEKPEGITDTCSLDIKYFFFIHILRNIALLLIQAQIIEQ